MASDNQDAFLDTDYGTENGSQYKVSQEVDETESGKEIDESKSSCFQCKHKWQACEESPRGQEDDATETAVFPLATRDP